jgi:hypothetical protein
MGRRFQRAGKKGIYHKNKNFKISRGGENKKWERRRQRAGKKGIHYKIKTLK